jgi:hypothetical protein
MLTDITYSAIEYISLNMRESDRVELFNIRPYDSPIQWAWDANLALKSLGRGRIAWWKGRPAGLFGFTEAWPGHWEVWMFGTDDYRNVAFDLLRWARKEANDILTVCEGRRLQADVREGHPDAHRLVRAMGAIPEGPPMQAYGKDGSAYQRYVWLKGVNDAVLKPHFKRAA